jgi:large subunit ribosomal protein L4
MTIMDVFNLRNEKVSEVEIKDSVFDVPVKRHVLHQVVVSQMTNRRRGSAATKNRSAVRSSGKKLYRQKGTGRARVGDAASPTRRGGGVAFGPAPRNYVFKVPKKIKKSALCMALTDKLQTEQLIIVDDLSLPEIKTKRFVEVIKAFDVRKALIVTEKKSENLEKSSKNVQGVKVLRHEGINVYDVLRYDHLIFERAAIGKVEEVLVS